jgi:hypothetical protein
MPDNVSGSNLASKLSIPDPFLEPLHAMLATGASIAEIDVEVRRLVIMAFVAGNERGIAYVVGMDKSDESIEKAGTGETE